MAKVVSYADTLNATNDAGYRAWGTAVNAAIAASGLVQTSDTGQINWTTVTKPTAATTVKGYEIWRFNDSLQSTAPVFIKIEYSSGGNTSGNNQQLLFTVGTATNGAGTITGNTMGTSVSASSKVTNTTQSTNPAQPIWACHTAGSSLIIVGPHVAGYSTQACMFSLSRTVDSTGALTGEGLYMWYGFNSVSSPYGAHRWLNFSAGTNSGSVTLYAAASPQIPTALFDTADTINVLSHYVVGIPYPVCGVVSTRDLAKGGLKTGTQFSCKVAGPSSSISRNYLVLFDGTGTNIAGPLLNNMMTGITGATIGPDRDYNGAAFLWE
jgi:hypothetical protein